MRCSECEKRLPMYADQTLAADLRQQVEAHLAACADCCSLEQSIVGISSVLGRIPPVVVPPDLAERAADHAFRQIPQAPGRVFAERFVSVGWYASAAVAVALVCLIALTPPSPDIQTDRALLTVEMEDFFLLSDDAWDSDFLLASEALE